MKKTLILLLFTLTLFSCSDPGGDPVFDGFEFDFRNKTNQEYTIEIVIGGMQNGTFVPTDSILMPSELIANKNISFYTEENRWKPNLNKIIAILKLNYLLKEKK